MQNNQIALPKYSEKALRELQTKFVYQHLLKEGMGQDPQVYQEMQPHFQSISDALGRLQSIARANEAGSFTNQQVNANLSKFMQYCLQVRNGIAQYQKYFSSIQPQQSSQAQFTDPKAQEIERGMQNMFGANSEAAIQMKKDTIARLEKSGKLEFRRTDAINKIKSDNNYNYQDMGDHIVVYGIRDDNGVWHGQQPKQQ